MRPRDMRAWKERTWWPWGPPQAAPMIHGISSWLPPAPAGPAPEGDELPLADQIRRLARLIHENSSRMAEPIVSFNTRLHVDKVAPRGDPTAKKERRRLERMFKLRYRKRPFPWGKVARLDVPPVFRGVEYDMVIIDEAG